MSDQTPKKQDADPYVAKDGKHYWNCWTNNYMPERDGFVQHAFCEEDGPASRSVGAK